MKFLLWCDGDYFIIPSSYQGRFRACPKQINSVEDLLKHNGDRVLVVKEAKYMSYDSVNVGDVLDLTRRRLSHLERVEQGKHHRDAEVEVLLCTKESPGAMYSIPVSLPTFMEGVFEPIPKDTTLYSITNAHAVYKRGSQFELVRPDPRFEDILPQNTRITLDFCIREPEIMISLADDKMAMHLPTRTDIQVSFMTQIQHKNVKLAELDSAPEKLSAERYNELAAQDHDYETVDYEIVNAFPRMVVDGDNQIYTDGGRCC
ncbi:unnamed protein product [Owenia fusiformis]|uniref:CABIT domain-containing protein n=1 Tax=Owenia fusiformis TaxID=6347 RepID=A0A8S4N425_OWEFU|nr:unnamed protein product [Owenia fusiformis]